MLLCFKRVQMCLNVIWIGLNNYLTHPMTIFICFIHKFLSCKTQALTTSYFCQQIINLVFNCIFHHFYDYKLFLMVYYITIQHLMGLRYYYLYILYYSTVVNMCKYKVSIAGCVKCNLLKILTNLLKILIKTSKILIKTSKILIKKL